MNRTVDFEILRCKLRLKRFNNFIWWRYFIKIFILQLIMILLWLILFPNDFEQYEPFELLGIIFVVILFVCAVLTPIITFWYKYRAKTIRRRLDQLLLQQEHLNNSEKDLDEAKEQGND